MQVTQMQMQSYPATQHVPQISVQLKCLQLYWKDLSFK